MKANRVDSGMLSEKNQARIVFAPFLPEVPEEKPVPCNENVEKEIRRALEKLTEMEREIVERFFFLGQKQGKIGAGLGLSEFRVKTVLLKAKRKLKNFLAHFVRKKYGVIVKEPICPICLSKKRKRIEKLLKTKTKEEGWKRILRQLREKHQIRTNSRSLQRHLSEHMPPERKRRAPIAV